MSHPTHHPLVHVLLCWIVLLSIVQVAFITYYLTARHHSLHQNNSVAAPVIKPLAISPEGPKMLSFRASSSPEKDQKIIQWESNNPVTKPFSLEDKQLHVSKDGHYFLNLQVTLQDPCRQRHTVRLYADKRIILQTQTNTESCSTGILSKVKSLTARQKLVVTVEPGASINTNDYVTHLDIIFNP